MVSPPRKTERTADLPQYDTHGDFEMAMRTIAEALGDPQISPLPADASPQVRDLHAKITAERDAFLATENSRRGAGRYYLTEAAELIVQTSGASVSDAVVTENAVRLLEAGRRGELTLRDPKTNLPVATREMTSLARVVTLTDLNGWLASSGAGHRVEPSLDNLRRTPPRAARSRMLDNEERILEALRARAIDPQHIPSRPKGKPWLLRDEIREAVKVSEHAFNHAWEALRKGGRIVES